jgi:hypothetical protein
MLIGINLVLWLCMLGAEWMPMTPNEGRWTAAVGFAFAALWQHAHVRGGWRKPRPDVP